MQPYPFARSVGPRVFLAMLLALACLAAACSSGPDRPSRAERREAAEAAQEAAEQAAPAEPPGDEPLIPPAPAVTVPVVPSGVSAGEAIQVVGQAYRELTARLFREVKPSDLFAAGWKNVRDDARRQGFIGIDQIQPFSQAGSADIEAFSQQLSLFLSGPGAGLDAGRLAQAAIRGMTAAVGDSHTRYVTPQQAEFQDSGDGTYSGIGVVTNAPTGDGITISRVYAGSPAEQAGLRPGDRIIGVNGADIRNQAQSDVSRQIRGEPGTDVVLTLVNLKGEQRDVTINRARIVQPVIASRMLEDNIGYLSVSQFPRRSPGRDAAAEFEAALAALQAAGARGFVLDLRDNPGGDPFTSVDIASNFTQDGPIFVAVDRNNKRTVYNPNRNRKLAGGPVVVLINQNSASGAEVVASALAEYGAAYLIGGTTCGCLSVGQPLRLEDQSQIVITVQQALTGRLERSLEGKGLDPDEFVRSPRPGTADEQIERAVQYLQEKLQ